MSAPVSGPPKRPHLIWYGGGITLSLVLIFAGGTSALIVMFWWGFPGAAALVALFGKRTPGRFALLALSICFLTLGSYRLQQQAAAFRAESAPIIEAVEAYRAEHGHYPQPERVEGTVLGMPFPDCPDVGSWYAVFPRDGEPERFVLSCRIGFTDHHFDSDVGRWNTLLP